jgi:hypothetical protein
MIVAVPSLLPTFELAARNNFRAQQRVLSADCVTRRVVI